MARAAPILVVEDDREIREILVEYLKYEGHQVLAAENGQVALSLLQSMNELPCLILLDISMPVMDGYKFREEQKKDARLNAIPTAMISADGNVKLKAESAGLVEYLHKPVDINDLTALVTKYCIPSPTMGV